jgi:hypothetical protein
MAENDQPKGGGIAGTGAYLMLLVSIAGLAVALFYAINSGQQPFQFKVGDTKNMMVMITGGISCLLMLIGSLMQK